MKIIYYKLFLVATICLFGIIASAQLVELWTQNEVDSFSINYPNVTTLDELKIHGFSFDNTVEIQNLDGLSQLTRINHEISIRSTALESLQGLHNIVNEIDGMIIIGYNESLTSLNGLNNIRLSQDSKLLIEYNSLLTTCKMAGFCSFLKNGGRLYFAYNGTDCNSWSDFYLECDEPVLDRDIAFTEGFEFWNDTLPISWTISEIGDVDFSKFISKTEAISEGEYSLRIQGYQEISFSISKELNNINSSMDISFSCTGHFDYHMSVEMRNSTTNESLTKEIMNVGQHGGNKFYEVQILNLSLDEGFDEFSKITFSVNTFAFNASAGEYIAGVMLIDDLKVYKHNTNGTHDIESKVDIYPNPTSSLLEINTYGQQYDQIEIFDLDGNLRKTQEFSLYVDVQDLLPGIFILKLRINDRSITTKFVKI